MTPERRSPGRGIGEAIPRAEDRRLLRGLGRFVDDLCLPGMAHLYALRSPHAAALIRSIDSGAARAMPGVLAVYTHADAAADGLRTIASWLRVSRRDGTPNFQPPYALLAHQRVRFVGDIVAVVVAESLALAKDSAECVVVDYEPLPAVTATADAARPDAPLVWEGQPDNICYVAEFGKKAVVDAAFARAAHVARVAIAVNRVAHATIEPRGAVAAWDAADERYLVQGSFQTPHAMRSALAHVLREPETRFRVVAQDVGGSFGLKGGLHPEYALVCWAARKLGRPVKWIAERSEAFLGDHQARDARSEVELALDGAGKFLALRVRNLHNLGAYLSHTGIQPGIGHVGQLAGVYTTPAFHVEVTGVFSNTTPTSVYRGAGRPEIALMLERVIDVAANGLGIDRAELRRRNLIPAAAMPYDTGFVFTYDSGEFEKNQDQAISLADWRHFEARRAEAKLRGKLRGIGLAHVIEQAGSILDETAEIRFDAGGALTLLVGTHGQGQGQETTYCQLLASALGIAPEAIRLRSGDTDVVAFGRGTFGSRSISVGGAAVLAASREIVERGMKLAGYLLEAAEADIEFADGAFRVRGTDKAVALGEVAKASYAIAQGPQAMARGLAASVHNIAPGITFPNGCHICEVEIDPETGSCAVVGYWVVDDVGRMVNPMIVKGQLHGGIAQGAGQALWENIAYDRDSGQNLTGSFMDYAIARAADLPAIAVASNEVLSKNNPLGIKGAGEAGAVGSLPAAMNAVCDALRPLGIAHFDMPASPTRLWRTIAAARAVTG